MADARILITGDAIRSINMSDIHYTKYGSIQRFTSQSVQYVYCTKKVDPGYYNYDKYLDFIATGVTRVPADLIPFKFDAFKAQDKDLITVKQRTISTDFQTVCWPTHTFSHVKDKIYGNYENIILPSDAQLVTDPDRCTHIWYYAYTFYDNFISKAIAAQDKDFAETLADIEQIIENIEQNIFSVLDSDLRYKDYINNQRILWGDGITYDYDIKEKYVSLYARLQTFYQYFQSYRKSIGNDPVLVFIYLASVMDPSAIKALPLDTKMEMLSRLADRRLYNWQLFYNPEKDQSVIVTIVQSIDESQADQFLALMVDRTKKYTIYSSCLFINLYLGLDNTHFGIGKSNLKNFVFSMYFVWKISSYNPYQTGVFNSSNISKYTYNNILGTTPNGESFWTTLNLHEKILNFNAAPVTLNYTSAEFAGIYFDNFKFYFDEGHEQTNFDYDMRFFDNSNALTEGKIKAVQDNYRDSGGKGLYGTYDYLQPVALVDSNQEAIMRIPVIDAKDPAQIDGQKFNSLIPIFVLKYIDDAGDDNDFNTVIGYFIDVVSLFAGGYGLIEKFRYLRYLSEFSDAIVGGSDFGGQTLRALYGSTAFASVNFTTGAASLLFKLSGNAYKDRPWYKHLITTLTWLEILSTAGSVLADKLLKVSAGNLVTDFNDPAIGWPEEFTSDPRGPDAVATLEAISGITAIISGTLFDKFSADVDQYINQLLLKEDITNFPRNGADGLPLHLAADLLQLKQVGYSGKLTVQETAELIHISYKFNKRIITSQLLLQMKYYIYVTKVKGFPAGFQSMDDYIAFCNDVKNYWINTLFDLSSGSHPGLKAISYELKVQGSALRKRLPTDPLPSGVSASDYDGLLAPADIEYAILMDETNFNEFLDGLYGVVSEIKDPKIKRKLIENIRYARKEGKGNFRYSNFSDIPHNSNFILDEMRSQCTSHLPGFTSKQLNFSIIRKSSRLDLGPYLDFKYSQ